MGNGLVPILESPILRGTVVGITCSSVSVRWDVPLQMWGYKVYISVVGEGSLERTRALQPIKYLKQFNMVCSK
jgi:hypothetical protein